MKSLQNVLVDVSTSRKAKRVLDILERFRQKLKGGYTYHKLSKGIVETGSFFLAYDQKCKAWEYATETLKLTDVIQPITLRNRLAKELLKDGSLIVIKLNDDPSIEVFVQVKYLSSPKVTEQGPVIESEDITIGIYEDDQLILSPAPQRASIGNTVRLSEFSRFAGFEDVFKKITYNSLNTSTHLSDALSYAIKSLDILRLEKRNSWKLQPLSRLSRPFFGTPLGGTVAGKVFIDETLKRDSLLEDLRKSLQEFQKEPPLGLFDGIGPIPRKHLFTTEYPYPIWRTEWPVLRGRTFDVVKDFLSGDSDIDGLESILKEFPLPPISKLWEQEIMNKSKVANASPWPEIGSLCAFWDGTYDEKTNKSVGILTNVDGFPFNTRYTCNHSSTYENARNVTPESAPGISD